MAKKFKSLYIDHVLHQHNMHADALASLVASLALPNEATEKVLIYNHNLCCPNSPLKKVKLQEKTFKSKRFWRLQQVQNSEIGDSQSLTSSYKASCSTTPKRQSPSAKRLLDSTTIRLRGHYITDRMMESYSTAFHTKSHRRHPGKLTTVCAELTNLDLSLETGFEDLATIGRDDPWCHHLC